MPEVRQPSSEPLDHVPIVKVAEELWAEVHLGATVAQDSADFRVSVDWHNRGHHGPKQRARHVDSSRLWPVRQLKTHHNARLHTQAMHGACEDLSIGIKSSGGIGTSNAQKYRLVWRSVGEFSRAFGKRTTAPDGTVPVSFKVLRQGM
jgi:hypothetical protein